MDLLVTWSSFTVTPSITKHLSRWSEQAAEHGVNPLTDHLFFSRSLSPDCTPLKQRYDTCFNAWFEGYLQPNLAAGGSNSLNQPIYSSSSSSSPGSSSSGTQPPNAPSAGVTGIAEQGGQPTPVTVEEVRPGKPLITSWSNALRRRAYPTSGDAATGIIEDGGIVETEAVAEQKGETGVRTARRPIDTRGKNRAQIKAEEYERDCGDAFRAYQGCLVVSG